MVQIEEEVLKKALTEVREYAEMRGMVLVADTFSIKAVKDLTEEVERCLSEAVAAEAENAEKTCKRSCGLKHEDATEWQLECLDVCVRCWMMTRRAECAESASLKWIDHLYSIETILKLYGLWYHSYSRVIIDEKVLLILYFKYPQTELKDAAGNL